MSGATEPGAPLILHRTIGLLPLNLHIHHAAVAADFGVVHQRANGGHYCIAAGNLGTQDVAELIFLSLDP